MIARVTSKTGRSDRDDRELRDPTDRDVLDSSGDSWRDREFLEMLDEIGSPPEERERQSMQPRSPPERVE